MNPLELAVAFVTQVVGYFALTGLLWVLVWKVFAGPLKGRKVPVPRPADRAQLWHEARWSTVTLLIGTVSVVVIKGFAARGWASFPEDLNGVGAGRLAATFFGLLLVNDLWFYAVHRLLHTPWAFKHIHSVHHRSVEVNPFTSYSFHPVEAFLLGAWIYPAVLLVSVPMPVLAALQALGLANNLMSHLGYEAWPKWLVRVPGLRWVNSATFHSQHHTKVKGNFGLMLRVWDHLLGTAVPGYDEVFVKRGE